MESSHAFEGWATADEIEEQLHLKTEYKRKPIRLIASSLTASPGFHNIGLHLSTRDDLAKLGPYTPKQPEHQSQSDVIDGEAELALPASSYEQKQVILYSPSAQRILELFVSQFPSIVSAIHDQEIQEIDGVLNHNVISGIPSDLIEKIVAFRREHVGVVPTDPISIIRSLSTKAAPFYPHPSTPSIPAPISAPVPSPLPAPLSSPSPALALPTYSSQYPSPYQMYYASYMQQRFNPSASSFVPSKPSSIPLPAVAPTKQLPPQQPISKFLQKKKAKRHEKEMELLLQQRQQATPKVSVSENPPSQIESSEVHSSDSEKGDPQSEESKKKKKKKSRKNKNKAVAEGEAVAQPESVDAPLPPAPPSSAPNSSASFTASRIQKRGIIALSHVTPSPLSMETVSQQHPPKQQQKQVTMADIVKSSSLSSSSSAAAAAAAPSAVVSSFDKTRKKEPLTPASARNVTWSEEVVQQKVQSEAASSLITPKNSAPSSPVKQLQRSASHSPPRTSSSSSSSTQKRNWFDILNEPVSPFPNVSFSASASASFSYLSALKTAAAPTPKAAPAVPAASSHPLSEKKDKQKQQNQQQQPKNKQQQQQPKNSVKIAGHGKMIVASNNLSSALQASIRLKEQQKPIKRSKSLEVGRGPSKSGHSSSSGSSVAANSKSSSASDKSLKLSGNSLDSRPSTLVAGKVKSKNASKPVPLTKLKRIIIRELLIKHQKILTEKLAALSLATPSSSSSTPMAAADVTASSFSSQEREAHALAQEISAAVNQLSPSNDNLEQVTEKLFQSSIQPSSSSSSSTSPQKRARSLMSEFGSVSKQVSDGAVSATPVAVAASPSAASFSAPMLSASSHSMVSASSSPSTPSSKNGKHKHHKKSSSSADDNGVIVMPSGQIRICKADAIPSHVQFNENGEPISIKNIARAPRFTPPSVRDYVNQSLTPELNAVVSSLLAAMQRLQIALLERDPVMGTHRRWFVVGLRLVQRDLWTKSIKAVILAPNIDEISAPGGLDSKVQEIIEHCKQHDIPVVFALSTKKIGTALQKAARVSAIGIKSINNVAEEYKQMLRLAEEGKRDWKSKKEAGQPPSSSASVHDAAIEGNPKANY